MTVGQVIRQIIAEHAGSHALLQGRVYPRRRPQKAPLPAVVYHTISAQHPPTHDGDTGHVQARLQLDVWAASHDAAVAICQQLRLALHGYRGTVGDRRVESILLMEDSDAEAGIDAAAEDGDDKIILEIRAAMSEPTS